MVSAEEIKFYYSGAKIEDEYQDNPIKSLGGFKSSVKIFNNSFDNLFDEVGIYELNNGQTIYRCIFIKNENTTQQSAVNLSLYIEGKKSYEKIKFGVSLPATDGSVQLLDNHFSQPFNITFYEAYTQQDSVILKSSLSAGQKIALWLCREIEENVNNRNELTTLLLNFSWT